MTELYTKDTHRIGGLMEVGFSRHQKAERAATVGFAFLDWLRHLDGETRAAVLEALE